MDAAPKLKPAVKPRGFSPSTFVVGLAGLIVALSASAMLVAAALGTALPGCGEGGGCGELTESVWGKLPTPLAAPFDIWPVSHLGLAYFVAMLGMWTLTAGRPTFPMRWLGLFGAIGSLVFLGVMVTRQTLCVYCLISHLGNLTFVVALFAAHTETLRTMPSTLLGLLLLLTSTGSLAALEQSRFSADQREADAVLDAIIRDATGVGPDSDAVPSTDEFDELTSDFDASGTSLFGDDDTWNEDDQGAEESTGDDDPAPSTDGAWQPCGICPTLAELASEDRSPETTRALWRSYRAGDDLPGGMQELPPDTQPGGSNSAPFSGRYRIGPDVASIRIVSFVSYQCKLCKDTEIVLAKYAREHPQVALSLRHYPGSTACNPFMKRNMHPRSCDAARGAEAAGAVRGAEGFWQMTDWIFSRAGNVTLAQLRNAAVSFGYNQAELQAFDEAFNSPKISADIQRDIRAAGEFGLTQTPTIFVNGRIFRGWRRPQDLPRLLDRLLTQNLPARSHAVDQPQKARDEFINLYRRSRQFTPPSRSGAPTLGPANAPTQVIIWGDYREAFTKDADKIVRDFMVQHDGVRYVFLMFPFEQSCNEHAPRTANQGACLFARAALAALEITDSETYWRFHDALLASAELPATEATLRNVAQAVGIDADELLEAAQTSRISEMIEEDTDAANAVGIRNLPWIMINGRVARHWRHDTDPTILEGILERVAQSNRSATPTAP